MQHAARVPDGAFSTPYHFCARACAWNGGCTCDRTSRKYNSGRGCAPTTESECPSPLAPPSSAPPPHVSALATQVYAGHPDQFSPVSESAYSAAASVYTMLLASAPLPAVPHSGRAASAGAQLRLFPAAPFANASFFRLRASGALLVSAVRERGATLWAAVEADVTSSGEGGRGRADGRAGALVPPFIVHSRDWADAAVPALAVVATAGSGAVTAQPAPGLPGAFFIAGLTRGQAACVYPASAAAAPDFVVGVAVGRNASEANAFGSRFVYAGELP